MVLFPLQALGEAPAITLEQIQEYRKQKQEREARRSLEARRELGQRLLYDYGGWYRLTYMFFDDLNNEGTHRKTRALKSHDLRLWGLLNIDETHSLYFRERLDHTDFNKGSEFRRSEDDLNVDIDQGYYTLHIDEALKRYFNGDLPLYLDLNAGKFFTEIGNGLSYSRVAIGVELTGYSRYVDFKAFWFQTPPGETNIDFTVPGFRTEGQTRDFTGVQITYPRFFQRHNPYFYYLDQRDRTDFLDNTLPTRQKFDYDSQYFGLGSRGKVIWNLNYEVEGVREVGRSYADVTPASRTNEGQRPEDISAWSLDAKLENIFDVLTHPRLSFEYAFGSGDADRRLVTTTINGNAPRSQDHNFLYFGYIDTGYVVSPRLSNLQMLRLGLALSPLEFTKRYKKSLELGANYYNFHKHKRKGGISDFRANRNLGSLGEEIDVYANWKVVSDIFLNLNYGRFYPSNSYGDKSARDFFLVSVNFQF